MSNKEIKDRFIKENNGLEMQNCDFDKTAIIIKNISFQEASELCAKYGASGIASGGGKDFIITNFGFYK